MKEVGWCEAQNKTADRKTGKVDFCWFFFACQQKSGFVFCLENGQQRGGRKKGEKDDFLLPLTPPPPPCLIQRKSGPLAVSDYSCEAN